jgi:hypothetical protein
MGSKRQIVPLAGTLIARLRETRQPRSNSIVSAALGMFEDVPRIVAAAATLDARLAALERSGLTLAGGNAVAAGEA